MPFYYLDESRGAGYKIYQNTEKRQFIVEVATRYRVWKAILHKIPTLNWFHFIFVWSEYHGIRIYIDGEWVLQSVETYSNPKSTWRNDQEIFIGRPDKFYEIGNFGRFEIGHLVIWDYALKNIEEAKQAYKSSVRYDPMTSNCCHKKITGNRPIFNTYHMNIYVILDLYHRNDVTLSWSNYRFQPRAAGEWLCEV